MSIISCNSNGYNNSQSGVGYKIVKAHLPLKLSVVNSPQAMLSDVSQP